MKMSRLLVVLVTCLAAQSLSAQAVNDAASTLYVNRNTMGGFPLQSFMGIQDPNIITVEGTPNAAFALIAGEYFSGYAVPGLGIIHIRTDIAYNLFYGTLDSTGLAEINLPPNILDPTLEGTSFALQVAVADASQSWGSRLSGATQISVVNSMASSQAVSMPAGSVARMRGPMTSTTATSVTVTNITYNVDANTQFQNFTTLSSLTPGDWLVIDGRYQANGDFIALEICLENAETETRLRARVAGIGPAGIVLMGHSVYMTSDTIYDNQGVPGTYADITIGMQVEVRVLVGSDPFPSVTLIELNIPSDPEPEPELEVELPDPTPTPAPSFCS